MSETILINSLPTRTWNRLGVNETALTWGESADLGTERITAAGQTVRLDIAGSGEYSEQTVDIQAPAGRPSQCLKHCAQRTSCWSAQS